MRPCRLSLILLAFLLSGCANLATIRQSDPVNMLISAKSPKELTNAIAYESQIGLDSWNWGWDPAHVTESAGIYKLLITYTPTITLTGARPMAEITITPTASGGSRLEYRTFSLWGGKDLFWELICHCASPQTEISGN